MKKANPDYSVHELCSLFQLSESTYYAQQRPKPIQTEETMMITTIKSIAAETRSTYGRRRMKVALAMKGFKLGIYRTATLMKQAAVKAIRPTLQTMEKNRLGIMPKDVSGYIKPILTAIKNQIEKVDKKLLAVIDDCAEYKAKNAIIQSMPGVGNIVAMSLLSNMPELGFITNKQAAALIGVAPLIKRAGSIKVKEEYEEDDLKYARLCLWR